MTTQHRWLIAIGLLLALHPNRLWAADPVRHRISYGADHRQVIDVYLAPKARRAPLIVYIHGGGWSAGAQGDGSKAAFFAEQGLRYAAIAYRLVPDATVEQQLADLAQGIAAVRKQARALAINPDRIILFGHSSGAHLAALLATNPTWLEAAGVPFRSVQAAFLLDGAAYDVEAAMRGIAAGSPFYVGAFGFDPVRLAMLSPIHHVGGADAPYWLIVHNRDRSPLDDQGAMLAGALMTAGASASFMRLGGSSHMGLLNNLGNKGDPASEILIKFLRANHLARPPQPSQVNRPSDVR